MDCGQKCNVCDGRFLKCDMLHNRCKWCVKLMDHLSNVHAPTNWQRPNPIKELLVDLYATRFEQHLDLFTGQPLSFFNEWSI
jgi:hypothetical protein